MIPKKIRLARASVASVLNIWKECPDKIVKWFLMSDDEVYAQIRDSLSIYRAFAEWKKWAGKNGNTHGKAYDREGAANAQLAAYYALLAHLYYLRGNIIVCDELDARSVALNTAEISIALANRAARFSESWLGICLVDYSKIHSTHMCSDGYCWQCPWFVEVGWS